MKTLLLMRHAKSSWDDPGLRDFDRPLNKRGERDAPRMGRLLCEYKLIPDHVVTSAAVRARTTAQHVAEACRRIDRITITPHLYHADPDEWQSTIASFSPEWTSVLCVGHNPELEEVIGRLTRQYVTLPTAAIAHLTCDAADWPDFARSRPAVIHAVWRPKELK